MGFEKYLKLWRERWICGVVPNERRIGFENFKVELKLGWETKNSQCSWLIMKTIYFESQKIKILL